MRTIKMWDGFSIPSTTSACHPISHIETREYYSHPPTRPHHRRAAPVQPSTLLPSPNQHATPTLPPTQLVLTHEMPKALLRAHSQMHDSFAHEVFIHHRAQFKWEFSKEDALVLRMGTRIQRRSRQRHDIARPGTRRRREWIARLWFRFRLRGVRRRNVARHPARVVEESKKSRLHDRVSSCHATQDAELLYFLLLLVAIEVGQ